jgi:transglutaminase-like putative cysteine protease
MDRRQFIQSAALISAASALPRLASANTQQPFAPTPANGWRSFETTTRIALKQAADGATRAWVPLPSVNGEWTRSMGNLWQGNASLTEVHTDPIYGATMLYAEWSPGEQAPLLEVVSRFSTLDRAIDLTTPRQVTPLSSAERKLYTQPTALLPTNGIVRKTAENICCDSKTDLQKATALYEWAVENTARVAATRGCGVGDAKAMLESGNLTGKCADINGLYVSLARSVGLPARDVYGVRVADSRYGYKCLGRSGDISKAQHCRAEVWLSQFGWVPADPADVRKVILEEAPGLGLKDDIVVSVREKLFGAWEQNHLAYNFAHDVRLPHSKGPAIPFLMYPQAETEKGRLDSLDPAVIGYGITSRELKA